MYSLAKYSAVVKTGLSLCGVTADLFGSATKSLNLEILLVMIWREKRTHHHGVSFYTWHTVRGETEKPRLKRYTVLTKGIIER